MGIEGLSQCKLWNTNLTLPPGPQRLKMVKPLFHLVTMNTGTLPTKLLVFPYQFSCSILYWTICER